MAAVTPADHDADPRKLADTVREARDLLDRTKRAEWSTPAEASKMGKSGYAPRKAQLAEWVMELRAALDALVSLAEQYRTERDEARAEIIAAFEWIADNWTNDDDDPLDQSLAQAIEAIFKWGNGAWYVAGKSEERVVSAEAALRAAQAEVALAQARAEELEKALAVFDRMGEDANEARRLYAESGVVPIQALVVADRFWGAIKHRRSVLAASPQAGEAPSGGLLEQPMRREMGVDAPDFGPVLGEPAGDTLCDHCGRSLGVARNEITVDGSVVSVGVECRDCAGDETDEHAERKAAAEQELCRAADAYVWEPTDETMEALRNARAEWQTAVGRWRLARRQAGEHQAKETT